MLLLLLLLKMIKRIKMKKEKELAFEFYPYSKIKLPTMKLHVDWMRSHENGV
jgi:hypothetical protein